MAEKLIDPWTIETLHGVTYDLHLEELIVSMKEEGWSGRPLLVIERTDDFLAWTGTHRVYAAREVGFEKVPCYVVDESVLKQHGFDAFYGHCLDYERLAICKKIGDEEATNLMELEDRMM